jgi:hypothetical protein
VDDDLLGYAWGHSLDLTGRCSRNRQQGSMGFAEGVKSALGEIVYFRSRGTPPQYKYLKLMYSSQCYVVPAGPSLLLRSKEALAAEK